MIEGWKCPNCNKAHGPHVDTCPVEVGTDTYSKALLARATAHNLALKLANETKVPYMAIWDKMPDLPPALDRRKQKGG